MDKVLYAIGVSILLLALSGCQKQPDYTSIVNPNIVKGAKTYAGKDGKVIITKTNTYTGYFDYVQKDQDLPYDETDVTNIYQSEEGVTVVNFNDGKIALQFSTGIIAYGEIVITKNK